MNTFESYCLFGYFLEDSEFDELIDYLQLHFQNKDTVNDMAKGNIQMHALIFHCGWETKSLHTIFSYIFTSLSNYMRCGKNFSHWFFKLSYEIYGVFPPTLDNIKTEPEKVNLFF